MNGREDSPLIGGLSRDVSDRLAAAKLWLVSTSSPTTCGNLPYLATALYALIPIASDQVVTMTTDVHWRLYVNPSWVESTDIPDVAAHMAHAVWHLLADHPSRAGDMRVRTATSGHWKRAADATVAEVLRQAGLHASLSGPQALGLPSGKSAEEYYAALSGLPADDPADDSPKGPPDSAKAEGHGIDATCGSGCDGLARWYEVPSLDPRGAVGDADAHEIRRQVAIGFTEHQRGIGVQPGEWSRWVQKILEPVVPWTQVLASAVRRGLGWTYGHSDYTYTKISRRQAASPNVIFPAMRRPVPELAIIVDTSGSLDDFLLGQSLGEIDGVIRGMGVSDRSVTVLATDVDVHAVTRVRAGKDAVVLGGGGTDMRNGIRAALALRPRPTLIIVLTDGYTPWPDIAPSIPVLIVVIGRSVEHLPPTPLWAQRVECVPS